MDTALFFIFSFLEYVAIFYLTFRLFSFQLRFYIVEISLSSLLLTIISYVLRKHSFGFMDIFLQIVIFILLLRYLFKVHIYYSVVVSYGYIAYVVMQILILASFYLFHFLDNILAYNSIGAYIIQVVSIITALLCGVVIKKFDFRFSFVPTTPYGSVKVRGNNLYAFLLIVFECSIIAASYYYYITNFNCLYFVFVFVLFIVSAFILYLLNKKEYSYDR